MNNRLLQNYLNLSFNSDNLSINDQSPVRNEKQINKSKTSLTLINSENHGDLLTSSIINDYAFDNQINNLLKNTEDKNRLEYLDTRSIDFSEGFDSHLIDYYKKDYLECKNHNDEKDRNNKRFSNSSLIQEINRIPSFKKLVYSVSSVATQADMENGTFLVERKDYKYRNQKESDVESQIISIEIDLCNEMYENKFNNSNSIAKPKEILPSRNDNEKEVAYVKVNDLAAFKNCLNFQLEAAKAAANMIIGKDRLRDKLDLCNNHSKLQKMILRMSARSFKLLREDNDPPDFLFKSNSEIALNKVAKLEYEKPCENMKENFSKSDSDLSCRSKTKFFEVNKELKESPVSNRSECHKPQEVIDSLFQNNFYMCMNTQSHGDISATNLNTFMESVISKQINLENESSSCKQDPNKIYNKVETSNEDDDDDEKYESQTIELLNECSQAESNVTNVKNEVIKTDQMKSEEIKILVKLSTN